MKIAIGYHLQEGPWGGGNQFAKSLAIECERRGDSVYFDLTEPNLDIILLTDPRCYSPSVSFGAGAILRYLIFINPRALVVHRINECDERKGTRNMNRALRWGNYVADHTVFIASWLKELSVWQKKSHASTILNGGDPRVFRQELNVPWNGVERMKLVTHHWGGNLMKGFDVYSILDEMLAQPKWAQRIEFTYIGNLPHGYRFKNARLVPPLQGEALALELSRHHVYITASINEPAGMHHIEGALCGLPVIYRKSGALPEYCQGFGFEFENDEFIPALEAMLGEYQSIKKIMPDYSLDSDRMCAAYIDLFNQMIAKREEILQTRHLWRSPISVLRNIFLL